VVGVTSPYIYVERGKRRQRNQYAVNTGTRAGDYLTGGHPTYIHILDTVRAAEGSSWARILPMDITLDIH
jgi:hypothetical protein